MRIKKLHIILLTALTLLLSSCNINRFVPEGKYLVQKNKVVVENEYKEVTSTGLSKYITQKPYKNFWETNFKTWVFFKAERNPKSKFWKWMNDRFGKEPVYYEKIGADNSAKQMMRHLDNVGYFHSKVTHTVETRKRKATVTYHVLPKRPYTVNEIVYDIWKEVIVPIAHYKLYEDDPDMLEEMLIHKEMDKLGRFTVRKVVGKDFQSTMSFFDDVLRKAGEYVPYDNDHATGKESLGHQPSIASKMNQFIKTAKSAERD